jgi:hypothetical protein
MPIGLLKDLKCGTNGDGVQEVQSRHYILIPESKKTADKKAGKATFTILFAA